MCPFSSIVSNNDASAPETMDKNNNTKTATTTTTTTATRVLPAIFATVVYLYLVASLVSWWLFLVPNDHLPTFVTTYLKVYSMELSSTTAPTWYEAFATNVTSMFVFGLFHSVLARKSIKQYMNLPKSIERSVYCLQGAFLLHMIQRNWTEVATADAENDVPDIIWDVSKYRTFSNVLLTIYWFGSAFLLSATFALDHFHLFGLSQGYSIDINKIFGLAPSSSEQPNNGGGDLITRWHYRYVAHPIMTGMLLNLWSTPIMTPSRLLCAGFLSLYIIIAVIGFEEPSIRNAIGSMTYDKYLDQTPRFFPTSGFIIRLKFLSGKEEKNSDDINMKKFE
jgi:protein-S-isoprenylcysteine O-methyltransferase Ste14